MIRAADIPTTPAPPPGGVSVSSRPGDAMSLTPDTPNTWNTQADATRRTGGLNPPDRPQVSAQIPTPAPQQTTPPPAPPPSVRPGPSPEQTDARPRRGKKAEQTQSLYVRLPQSLCRNLKLMAVAEDCTLSQLVADLLSAQVGSGPFHIAGVIAAPPDNRRHWRETS